MARKKFFLEWMLLVWFSLLSASLWGQAGGGFAYVANFYSNDVSAYTINGATGALTEIAGSPFPAGMGPISVAVDTTGKFACVANLDSGEFSAYAISATTGH